LQKRSEKIAERINYKSVWVTNKLLLYPFLNMQPLLYCTSDKGKKKKKKSKAIPVTGRVGP
jgi:hypothetical protein